MKKILVIFGTRPEAIKVAPVIILLKKDFKNFYLKVCVTAQHREMLDQVLNLFKIEPDYDLNIMRDNQSLFDVTVEGLRKIEIVLKKEKPDMVLVQGDTTTTYVASLAAYYLKIRTGHIEAGLRTANKFNPFPEEMNRRLTDCLVDFHFPPTEKAKRNLLNEGVPESKILVTGNTVIDALLKTVSMQKERKTKEKIEEKFLDKYGIKFDSKKIILVTSHRRESFGKNLENICHGLNMIVESNPQVKIVFPVHLNPNVQKPVKKILNNIGRIHLIDPLDYFDFVYLMRKAYLILTDSGGIQEEAPSLGKPVLVMRKTTERQEGIRGGTAKLVGTDKMNIFNESIRLITNKKSYHAMAKAINPYGDGKASERIITFISTELKKES